VTVVLEVVAPAPLNLPVVITRPVVVTSSREVVVVVLTMLPASDFVVEDALEVLPIVVLVVVEVAVDGKELTILLTSTVSFLKSIEET